MEIIPKHPKAGWVKNSVIIEVGNPEVHPDIILRDTKRWAIK